MVDRRMMLRAGAATALATATGLVGQRESTAAPRADRRDWTGLLRRLSPLSTLYRPGEASYDALSVPFNHRYANVRPLGILVPGTVDDVRVAIRWARANDVPLVARTGLGHNYAGYSTTTGLLLIMSRLRDITVQAADAPRRVRQYGPIEVSSDAGLSTVAAGITNADLQPLLARDGILIPSGRCPTVGVAGLVLGGGIGFSDKMFGLTCDRLVSTTVVLADGSVVTCDENTEPDLFWGCRGGAGNNFGVNTSFTFSYEQLRGNVTFYSFTWPLDLAVEAITAFQEVARQQQANRQFDCRIGVGTSGRDLAAIRANGKADAIGQYYGSAADFTRIIEPVLDIGTPQQRQANRDSIREVPPIEAAGLLSATTPVNQFGAKSAVLTDPLTPAQLEQVVSELRRWPGSANPDGVGIALFGFGGRVNRVPPHATAFVHRNGLFVFAAEAAWADDDPPSLIQANIDWLDGFYDAIFDGVPPRSAYQNFPDPDLRGWQYAYYGPNYPRLREVKSTYDPTNFFHYPQGIQQVRSR